MIAKASSASILLITLMSLPLNAQQYASRRNGDVVQLEDARAQIVVSIIPSVGNTAFEMTVKGQNVLRFPYRSVEEFKAKPGLSGIPFLSPWANRLDELAFYASGKRYAFDMDLGNVRGPVPGHGFLSSAAWDVVEAKADAHSAWVTSRLDFYKQPMWMKQFPFAHTAEMTYRLQDGVLEVQTRVANLAAEPMPVSFGYHPFYQLTDSPRDEWTITIPARTRWLLAPVKMPTGETEPAEKMLPGGRGALKDLDLDDVFSDLVRDPRGRAMITLKGRSQQLDIQLGPNFRSLVMYSPNPSGTGLGSNSLRNPNAPPPSRGTPAPQNPLATSNFICFEPMTGITNALNLAHKGVYKELQYIQPGGVWQESFWIKPSGF
jgi:aldose 1-epimerase